MKPAFFLDRDGTVSREVGYVNHPRRLELLPRTAAAISRARAAGYLCVLVTNQAGVARGYFPEEMIHETHRRLADMLAAAGTTLDGVYYCPHHPDTGAPPYRQDCDCRKPRPGMVTRAVADLDIDVSNSIMVGDKITDVEMGLALGMRGIMVRTGYGRGEEAYQRDTWTVTPDHVAKDLLDAVAWVLDVDDPRRTAAGAGRPGMSGNLELRRRLLALVDRFPQVRLALWGDFVVDEFVLGQVNRISREAPVLILDYLGEDRVPGGAANTAANIASLGATPVPVGVVGDDTAGHALLSILAASGMNTGGILVRPELTTPTKTRVSGAGLHTTRQQIVRIDRGAPHALAPALRRKLAGLAGELAQESAGLVVGDYGYDTVDPGVVRRLARAGKTGLVAVDSRWRLLQYRGVSTLTPNEPEVQAALDIHLLDQDEKDVSAAGGLLMKKLALDSLVITRGSKGMAVFTGKRKTPSIIPVFGTDEVADVTGAGDTVMAAYAVALAAGARPEDAAHLANFAGGLVVMKQGTATITPAELRRAIRSLK